MRLIDRDLLLKDLCDFYNDSINVDGDPCTRWVYRAIEEICEYQPIINAPHIKHGHWLSLTDCSNVGVYCSVCHKKVYKEDYAPYGRKNKVWSKYCPNCGAKMGEEEENY